MPQPQRALVIGGGLYAIALAVIALWPTEVDGRFDVVNSTFVGHWLLARGFTPFQAYDLIEFSANVALYAPLGMLAMIVSTRVRWWHAVALAFTVSAVFETLQAGVRPGRNADLRDIVANTLGAAIGAALVVVVRRLLAAKSRS